jgi:hypothetical protein
MARPLTKGCSTRVEETSSEIGSVKIPTKHCSSHSKDCSLAYMINIQVFDLFSQTDDEQG